MDVTWDIKEKGNLSFMYDYFNLPDNLIRFDHSWATDLYPPCVSLDYNYYHRNALYVKRPEEIVPFVRRRVKAGERYIAFKYASNDLPPDAKILSELSSAMQGGDIRGEFWTVIARNTHNVYLQIDEKR